MNPPVETHPPKPRLALNVGVTGHRPNRLNPDQQETLRASIAEVLERIAQAFHELAGAPGTDQIYDLDEQPALRLLSPLAEGADRIAAESALAAGYEVQCPLPFPVDEYRKDFEEQANHPYDTRGEFDGLLAKIQADPRNRILELDGIRQTEGDKNLAYWKAGQLLLRHSDILLAIWDGIENKTSVGTAGMVARAGRDRIPTVRILAHQPDCIEFRDHELTGNTWRALAVDDSMEQRIRQILLPPQPPAPSAAAPNQARDCKEQQDHGTAHPPKHPPEVGGDSIRCAYFQHPEPKLTPVASSYRLFFAALGKRQLNGWNNSYQQGALYQWDAIETAITKLPVPPPATVSVETELRNNVRKHFLWADRLATYYADEYRGTYCLMFSLTFVAVFLALLSGPFRIFEDLFDGIIAKLSPWLTFGELISIGVILWLWFLCHHRQLHERWLDFRLLAELLRQRMFLLPIGGMVSLEMPDYATEHDRSYGWVLWLTRAVNRAEGLPAVPAGGFTQAYRQGYTEYLAELLCDQVRYHAKNFHRNNNIAMAIHTADYVLMCSIIVACFIHFGAHFAQEHFEEYKKILGYVMDIAAIAAAVLPALGAALHGLFGHGEYRRVADRSEGMLKKLKSIVNELSLQGGTPLSAAKLENLAEQANEAMSQELTDWRVIFRAKPLEPHI
ncbi:hypothetical protein SAMN02949497_3081 [Methylomagnum ishizawai]|uniref:SMODS and SLOG-associating 2TM effector domain-containing protein n=1 Tax=Methylomagnum ishizawai TaxID=1760988 RepID=A0A1Y6CZA4_9GAMM|nr:hypothetical protein SAMN02949497_3081 [Methylomagnum ishizawai]